VLFFYPRAATTGPAPRRPSTSQMGDALRKGQTAILGGFGRIPLKARSLSGQASNLMPLVSDEKTEMLEASRWERKKSMYGRDRFQGCTSHGRF